MKTTIIYSIIVVTIFCQVVSSATKRTGATHGRSIYGTWKQVGVNQETLIIKKDGSLNGRKDAKLDFVTAVKPMQIYLVFKDEEATVRIPFGIFKIVGNDLIISPAIEYQRTYGGLAFGGTSRTEFPKDFSGTVYQYKRIAN